MRTKQELLQVYLDNEKLFVTGLCYWTQGLHYRELITEEEASYINTLISKKKPIRTRLQERLHFLPYKYRKNTLYYWKIGEIEPRIKFLKRFLK